MWSFVTKDEVEKLYELEPFKEIDLYIIDDLTLAQEKDVWTADGAVIPEKVANMLLDRDYKYINVRYYEINGVIYKRYNTGLCLKNTDDNPVPSIINDKTVAKYKVEHVITKVYDTDEGVTLYQHHLATIIDGVTVDKISDEEYNRCMEEADLTCYYTYREHYFISVTGKLYDENGKCLGDAEGYEEYIPDLWRHPEYDRDIPDENL